MQSPILKLSPTTPSPYSQAFGRHLALTAEIIYRYWLYQATTQVSFGGFMPAKNKIYRPFYIFTLGHMPMLIISYYWLPHMDEI